MNATVLVPPFLKSGDTIALVATARFIEEDALRYALDEIAARGWKVKRARNIHTRTFQFAGNDQERAAAFNAMLHDDEVKALLVVRGGYGTVRMVDHIDWEFLKTHPKWICGFSDVTVLHNFAAEKLNMATLHAAMPVTYENNSREAKDSLFDALTGKSEVVHYPARIIREGSVHASVVGGNLSVIYSQLGSSSQVNTHGKVLFIEDLDEYLYHLDRMMWALKRAELLDGIVGLMVGGLTAMRDNTREFDQATDNPFGASAEEIILSAVGHLDIPIAFDLPIGHLSDNRSLLLNCPQKLCFEKGEVLVEQG